MINGGENHRLDQSYVEYIKANSDQGIKDNLRTLFVVILGSALIGINIKIFLNQANLLPAGINGVTALIQRMVRKYANKEIPFTLISMILNIFPTVLAFIAVGKKFTLYSVLSIVMIAVSTDLFPQMPVTQDWLLIAIFGGLLNGFGNSFILKHGASTGGFDFVAMYFSVKKGIYTFNYVFAANATIILISGIFFGVDSALYTIIYQFVSNQIIRLVYTRYSKKTLLIITDKPEEISENIKTTTNHACTIFEGKGGYTGETRKIVYSIVGAQEVDFVMKNIKEIDPDSFVNTINSDSITGNFYLPPIA